MSSRLTLFLAGVLLLGAIIAGYAGWTLSHQAPPAAPAVATTVATPERSEVDKVVAQAQDELRHPVVVAVRDLQPLVPLTAADLGIEQLRFAPAGSLGKIEDAVGRQPARLIAQGTWLSEHSFDAGGPLARMIHDNERALAVNVDDVIGAGGHLSPGDYVDVLLFLPMDVDNAQKNAQVIVPALRVLSVGALLGGDVHGQPVDDVAVGDEQVRLDQRRNGAHTVVLAVPEALLTRLMLAVHVGSLRLAVRSAEEHLLAGYWAGDDQGNSLITDTNRDLFKFEQVALGGPPSRNSAQPTTSGTAALPTTAGARVHGVEVIRGSTLAQQNAPGQSMPPLQQTP